MKNALFSLVLAATSLCLAPVGLAQEAKAPVSLATTPDLHKGTEGATQNFNAISKKGEAQLVFLGDSITAGWSGAGKEAWNKHFAPLKAANFGIGGDRTEHILYRLQQGNLDGLSPKAVVLMIGTNNTGHRMGAAEDTAAGVKAILAGISQKCPKAKILLLAIFPRGAQADDKMRVLNTKINELLKPMADNKQIFFKDIGEKFLTPQGELTKPIMPDLLHLSPQGYTIWAESILEDVTMLMK